ncbi:MAG: hypothetical protein LBP58_10665 [Azoarcus sp.]|jgi:hypothetical protein|nr:hypothetical protein [Azoarcus sp.]
MIEVTDKGWFSDDYRYEETSPNDVAEAVKWLRSRNMPVSVPNIQSVVAQKNKGGKQAK